MMEGANIFCKKKNEKERDSDKTILAKVGKGNNVEATRAEVGEESWGPS